MKAVPRGSIAAPPDRTDALRDAAGTLHAPAGDDARIVCLVPSITELVCDLGLADRLVGRTGFCIHPWETVRTIPKLGGTKDVKLDRIRDLAPTHAILNIDENRRELADELAEFVPNIIVTHPLGPRDNLALYRLIGAIFDRDAAAERLCAELEHGLDELRAGAYPQRDVLYLIWRDPWMAVSPDTYIARTLELVNWRSHPLSPDDRYPEVGLEGYAGRVEHVLLSSEPYHFKERHLAEVAAAVPGAHVSLIDGEMTSWYGSRAIEGLRYLAQYASETDAGEAVRSG
jgi:ABC-type Fe3+-hydroxamate transport system substrate-binding protein